MAYDYVDSLVRLHSNVEEWTSNAVSALSARGIVALPVKFAENIEEYNFVVVLELEQFLEYCKLNNKPTVFIHGVSAAIQESVHLYILRADIDESDLPAVISEFCTTHADSLARTTTACPHFRRQEIFVTDNGSIVLTGAMSEAYEEFLDGLEAFCEHVKDKHEEEEIRREERNEEILSSLATELLADEKFKSIRGKRKRCLYVESAYRDRIPSCRTVKRPDANSDPMNSLLVDLIEQVTDRIDLANSMGN